MTTQSILQGYEKLISERRRQRDDAAKILEGSIGSFANVLSAEVLRHLKELNKRWMDISVQPGSIDIGKAIFFQGTIKVPQHFTRRDHCAFLLDPDVIEIKRLYAEYFRITQHSLNPVSLKWSYVQAVEDMQQRLSVKES